MKKIKKWLADIKGLFAYFWVFLDFARATTRKPVKKIKKWWADIKDFPCFFWYLLPFKRETTEKLARNNTEKLRSNLAREYMANKSWHEKCLFFVTENKILWVVFSFISFLLFRHVFLFLHEDVDFLRNANKNDANFLIATVQATLMGVIIPILIAVSDIKSPIKLSVERNARIKDAKLFAFFWSSVLLLVVAAFAESFSCTSTAYYCGQYGWFVTNLLLFMRAIIVYLRRAGGDAVFIVGGYAHNIESRIADIIFRRMGDNLDD